ncbi:hypothetical protein GGH95_001212 [Coemansia sp. RSA 1836]|nr:hypothetical protein GGH95_001212 [Coemansia sp. RSA 1836]
MLDLTAEFEAMMANVTAPPLSLAEFRLFVVCDSKARNALAFCEWYQRYRTVYFDRVSVPSTRATAASSRPAIPREFARADLMPTPNMHASATSLSALSVRVHGQRAQMLDRMYALKPHSFSALSESMVDSAFNTASTGTSGSSPGASQYAPAHLEPKHATDSPMFTHCVQQPSLSRLGCFDGTNCATGRDAVAEYATFASGASIARRRTLPLATRELGLGHELQMQEDNRQHIQSLLIFECWARFFDDLALERVDVPQTELLYIKERLPLSITHIPRPLLCPGDMLISVPLALSSDNMRTEELKQNKPLPHLGLSAVTEPRRLTTHCSLQLWPYEQLKRSLASQVRQHKTTLSRTQSPLSPCFGSADVDVDSDLDRPGEYLSSKSARKLRRISTMPALTIGGNVHRAIRKPATTHNPGQLPRPGRARRLISVGALQLYHNTLKPRPPFATAASDRTGALQVCGYRPVPRSICKLVVPSSIPPALFDTAAKLSAEYLLQNCFADFRRQAHFNLTQREQRYATALSAALFLAGAGMAAALVLTNVSQAWRGFALPLLFLSAVYTTAAWTRVSISMWWRRRRPTSLASSAYAVPRGDFEASIHAEGTSDPSLRSIRAITGTFVPFFPVGFVGAVYSTGGCSHSSSRAGSQSQVARESSPSMRAPVGAVSVVSLWSQLTVSAAVGDIFDSLVRVMLRKRAIGDQWFVELDSKLYEVAEPIVLRNQCYIVGHQLAILAVVWAVFATVVFMLS